MRMRRASGAFARFAKVGRAQARLVVLLQELADAGIHPVVGLLLVAELVRAGAEPVPGILVADGRRDGLEGLLAGAQGVRILGLQLAGELLDLGIQLRLRDGHRDQADVGRLLAGEGVAGEDVVQRLPRLHHFLHHLGHEPAGDVPEVDLGQAEGGLLRRDGDVDGAHDREGAAEAPAVDRGDGRPREEAQLLVPPGVRHAPDLLAAASVVLQLVEVLLQVLAGAEALALAGDDQHLGLRVELQLRERVEHLPVQPRAHRVPLFRPVEPNSRDAVGFLDQDRLVVGHDANSYLPLNSGLRFSAKARAPSLASSVPRAIWESMACRRVCSSNVISSPRRASSLLARTASGGLEVMRSASFMASGMSSAAGTTRLTRPQWYACSAVMRSPVSSISMAGPSGMARVIR